MNALSDDKIPHFGDSENTKTYVQCMKSSIYIRKIYLERSDTGIINTDTKATGPSIQIDSPDLRKISEGELGCCAGAGIGTQRTTRGYATTKQTVIIVSREGELTYVERTLWDEQENWIPNCERDRMFTFKIEDWPHNV